MKTSPLVLVADLTKTDDTGKEALTKLSSKSRSEIR